MRRNLSLITAILPLPLLLVVSACQRDDASDQEPGLEIARTIESELPPDSPEAPAAAVTVVQSQLHGSYLADAEGRALYLLEDEPRGQSTCDDQCAREWPPFVATAGTPAVGDPQVRQDLLGTIQRRDGTPQVTYNGHALYYYRQDERLGDVNGQDVEDQWGEWYLVTPAGAPLENDPRN